MDARVEQRPLIVTYADGAKPLRLRRGFWFGPARSLRKDDASHLVSYVDTCTHERSNPCLDHNLGFGAQSCHVDRCYTHILLLASSLLDAETILDLSAPHLLCEAHEVEGFFPKHQVAPSSSTRMARVHQLAHSVVWMRVSSYSGSCNVAR